MWRSSMALPTYSRQIHPTPALGCYQTLPFRWPCVVITSYYSLRAGTGSWSCSQAVSTPVWHVPLLRVQWKTLDDEQKNCPIHVEFYSKNKLKKFVHLVGFIIRMLSNISQSLFSYTLLLHSSASFRLWSRKKQWHLHKNLPHKPLSAETWSWTRTNNSCR
jgi:hypothetical protein